MKPSSTFRKIICLVTAFVLSAGFPIAMMPEVVRAETASEVKDWSTQIPRMLNAGDYEEGTVVVCIDPSVAGQNIGKKGLSAKADSLLDQAEEIMKLDPDTMSDPSKQLSITASDENEEVSLSVIRSEDLSTGQMLESLAGDDRVLFAEPNYVTKIETEPEPVMTHSEAKEYISDKSSDSSPVAKPGSFLNTADDLTPQQWSSSEAAEYHTVGKSLEDSMKIPGFGPGGSDMTGKPITVAVLDMPVDFSHPDLKNTAFTFSREQQKKLGCDVHGYNATWQSEDGKLSYGTGGLHGTHCAGILGASWDGHGISGVASNVKIVSIQIANADGRTPLINALRGFAFVKKANEETNADIRITSNSWGILQCSKALDAAIRDLGEGQGVISVFAAGNNAVDMSGFTYILNAAVDNPYAVFAGSTRPGGDLSSFSNYSERIVDLAAPGSGILSCCLTGEDELHYLPDASKKSNKLYEGYENGEPAVTVDIVDAQGKKAGAGSVSGDEGMVFAGHHAICLDLSKATPVEEGTDYKGYILQLELGDIASRGVKAGDNIAFSFGCSGLTYIYGPKYRSSEGESGGYYYYISHSYPYASDIAEFEIPVDMDLSRCLIKAELLVPPDIDKVWIDSIGAGGEKVPYKIASGTSMACPAVAGAAAVLASRCDARGSDLTDIVRASVRPMPALKDKTRTGGMTDLSVDVNAASQRGPVIDSMSCMGRTITLNGKGFGSSNGSVKLTKEVLGAEPRLLNAGIESWTDSRVCLILNEETKGVLKAVLTSSVSGKTDTIVDMFSLSDNIYGKDLPLDSSTGEPYLFDAPGDIETSGVLQAIGEKLFYLPAQTKVEEMPAHRSLYAFDLKTETWEEKAQLPVWMENISAASLCGMLYVKGSLMDVDESGQIPTSGDDPEAAVYAFDPDKDEWTECSSAEVDESASIAGDGRSLYLAGEVSASMPEKGLIRVYDPKTGAGKQSGTLNRRVIHPSAVILDGTMYLYDASSYRLESVKLETGAEALDLSDKLPDVYDSGSNGSISGTYLHEAVLLSSDEGILLIGPPAADGSSDNWLMKTGTKEFVPGNKRISDSRIVYLAAALQNGSVYVIGSSKLEAESRFFRTDTIDQIFPKESPQEPVSISNSEIILSKKDFTYNGRVQKPSILTIGGMKLTEGQDYTLKWTDASSVDVGAYSLIVTGKGNYSGTATATYKIDPKGTGIRKLKKGKRSVTVKWKKQSKKMSAARISGYQIQLSQNKTFTKNKKTVSVKGYKSVSKKVKGLKRGKKYYVHIRTYRTIRGQRFYSPWSKIRTVRTK